MSFFPSKSPNRSKYSNYISFYFRGIDTQRAVKGTVDEVHIQTPTALLSSLFKEYDYIYLYRMHIYRDVLYCGLTVRSRSSPSLYMYIDLRTFF